MFRITTGGRGGFFGLAVVASLGFGAAQALATPAGARECGVPATCSSNADCDAPCAARGYPDGGKCVGGNCCICFL